MPYSPLETPQVMAVTRVSRDGKAGLRKGVRQYLGGDSLYVERPGEVLLTSRPSATASPVEVHGKQLLLPPDVVQALGLAPGAFLALVEREGAVALKRMQVEEQAGDHARIVDLETPYTLTRRAVTNPMPATLLPALQARHAGRRLHFDPRAYLQGRLTLAAWRARSLLGCSEPGDDGLRERLAQARLDAQGADGSWEGDLLLTARNLRELAELGLTRRDAAPARAVGWLMARPQSAHNPGQWFANDDLVAEQAGVVGARQRGEGGRFRKLLTREQKRVLAVDALIRTPCGPRIMWPNALVLEALLKLGYEGHERVRTALHTLTAADWCECAYQHGVSCRRGRTLPSEEELDAFEQSCIAQYRYGGLSDLASLTAASAPPRAGRVTTPQGDGYELCMPDHIQGCEFITTRSLAQVRDPNVRRFAEAHLWRFAGVQRADGTFPPERYGTGFGQVGILEAVARYDHPASHVILLRAVPWMVAAQSADGSWGERPGKDAATLAMIQVLLRLRASSLPDVL